jgi:hypothetical protein
MRVEEPNQPPSPSSPDCRAPGTYYATEVLPEHSETSQQHGPHVRNFLNAVKTRQRPIADIEGRALRQHRVPAREHRLPGAAAVE